MAQRRKEILTTEQFRDLASSKEHEIAQPLVEASENAMEMLKSLGVAAKTITESTVLANLSQTIDFALKFAPRTLAASTAVLKMMEAPGQVNAGEIRRIATSTMAGQPDDLPANIARGLIPGTADYRRWGTRNSAKNTNLLQAEEIHRWEILPALQIFDGLAFQAEQAITANQNAGNSIEEDFQGMPAIRMNAQKTATKHDEKAKTAEEKFIRASEQSLRIAIAKMGVIQDDSELDGLLKELVESRINAREHRIKTTEAVAQRDRATMGIITTSMNHEAVTIVQDDSIKTASSFTLAWEILQAGHDLSLARLCCAISSEERRRLWDPQLKATAGILANSQKRLAQPEIKFVN